MVSKIDKMRLREPRIRLLLREHLGVGAVQLKKGSSGRTNIMWGEHSLYGAYARVYVLNRRREGSYRVYVAELPTTGGHVVKE